MTARLLYVEDDHDLRSFLGMILIHEGYEVTAVSSAEDALVELQTRRHQILLTDYNLPNKNADWMLQLARDSGWLQDVRVIVLTATAHPAGVDGYQLLRKPVDMTVLFAALDEAVTTNVKDLNASCETPAAVPPGTVVLTLYVTVSSRESKKAVRNLTRLLEKFDSTRVRVNICDVADLAKSSPGSLDDDRVVVTPTLVRQHPLPKVWVFGDLSQADVVEEMISAGLDVAS